MVRNRRGMARLIVLAGCAYALAAAAFPSRAELDKAEKLVNEIMSADVAAFKAKSKTAADVASAALGYADEAPGEAARFLLLKGAFVFQVRAADYDGAKATVGRIRAEISGVPDKVVADMLSSALRRVPRKHCGQLFELLQRTQNRVRYAQGLQTLAQKAKATPADKALRRQMGELHALLGDWGKAIESFAAGDGKFAAMAQWEQKYPETGITELTTAKVADFCWEAGGGDAERTRAYRAHAAYWYRKAIENGSLPGLTKALAEKRIAEAEKENDWLVPQKTDSVQPSADTTPRAASAAATVKRAHSQPPPRTLKLGNGVDIEFVGCPAGSFMMGICAEKLNRPESAFRYHKVNITRPFWLSKYKVTHDMWNAYRKVALTKEDQILGGMRRIHCVTPDEAEAFCAWLTKRFRSSLPGGYVIRWPTEAEWRYALTTGDGCECFTKKYGYKKDVVAEALKEYMVTWKDIAPKLEKAKIMDVTAPKASWKVAAAEVGTKKPNGWGLYDMLGNTGELTMDCFDIGRFPNGSSNPPWFNQDAIRYEEEETDPLHWFVGATKAYIWCGGTRASDWLTTPSWKAMFAGTHTAPFRLCIGPDLMKEKGFKK